MKEFDLLAGYPQPQTPRVVSPNLRTIQHRIIASYRGKEFYDGDRNFGYGGFKYDGRWVSVAKKICEEYKLTNNSAFLQIGSDKGFLLHDLQSLFPEMKIRGTEISDYAIEHSMNSIKQNVIKAEFTSLPFADTEFDFVMAMGAVYTLNLADVIKCLKEIQRVGKGKSFITLGSYQTEEEFEMFRHWTLLGTTILHREDWLVVLNHVGYTGDYKFIDAKSLNLQFNR